MIKTLDKYILKKFLGTSFFAILLFILIAVVFDISEKIDDFDRFTMKQIVVDYYFSFIPWLFNLLAPFITSLGVIYFTSRMANKTEIIPILASGISYNRFLRPYLIGATIMFITSLVLGHVIIPQTNKSKIAMEAEIYNFSRKIDNSNIHREIAPNTYIYVSNYSTKTDNGYKFRLEKIEQGKLVYQFTATKIKWLEKENKWNITNWAERTIDGDQQVLKQGNRKDTTFSFTKKEFHRSPYEIETMDIFEIYDYIEQEKQRGSSHLGMYQHELVRRTSTPFSIFILVIIAVCISSRKVKGGVGMHIAMGLAITAIFVFFNRIADTIAIHTPIPAKIALWVPNIIFAVFAYYIYKKAPK